MLTYATAIEIGRLIIQTWYFPGMEGYFIQDNNCRHIFGKFYWKGE